MEQKINEMYGLNTSLQNRVALLNSKIEADKELIAKHEHKIEQLGIDAMALRSYKTTTQFTLAQKTAQIEKAMRNAYDQ